MALIEGQLKILSSFIDFNFALIIQLLIHTVIDPTSGLYKTLGFFHLP
jgi:hypothetical protein